MQSLESKRTLAALRLCEGAACAVLATGTPLKNARPSNLFPLLRAVRHPLASDQRAYELRYCQARKTRWKAWDISVLTLDMCKLEAPLVTSAPL